MDKTYDTHCYKLARSFLEDSDAHPGDIPMLADALAKDIQQVIEDFFAERNLA